MGTALTAAEKARWVDFLRDLDGARRARWADLLETAPAVGHAVTLDDVQALDRLEDVEETIKDVAGFRVVDVKLFMQYWRSHTGAQDVSNKPVAVTMAMAAASAAIARGDSSAVGAAAVALSVEKAQLSAADTEGNSEYCRAAFRLKVDSSKLGRVAELGLPAEEAEIEMNSKGFEMNTTEYKLHLTSEAEWKEYCRDVKSNAREHKRFGLVDRITEFNDRLEAMGDWAVEAEYTRMYFKKHKCRMPVAHDSDLYLLALQKVNARRRGGGSSSSEGPPPNALMPPAGRLMLPLDSKGPTTPAAVDWAATVREETSRMMADLVKRIESVFGQLSLSLPAARAPPAPAAPPAQAPAEEETAETLARRAQKKAEKAERFRLLREKWAAAAAARKEAKGAAAGAPAAAGSKPRGFIDQDTWASMTAAQRREVHEARRQEEGEPAQKKKRGRSPAAAPAERPAGAPGATEETRISPEHPGGPSDAEATDGSQ